MKRQNNWLFALFSMGIILFVLFQNVNGSGPPQIETGPQAPAGITPTPTSIPPTSVPPAVPTSIPPPAAPPNQADTSCLRINFEVSGHFAKEGWYEVQESSGRVLTRWYANKGWQDSGWINELQISFQAVHVQVVYFPLDGSDSVTMQMYNPAPDVAFGWVSRGMCHALEVGWP
jgi:hypothetical protein